ncbi:ribosome-inactivating protein [Rostrohypoxylon terebratum]|nr:ribosome-inactivating protein [Rostrohypoxylon terebratum]
MAKFEMKFVVGHETLTDYEDFIQKLRELLAGGSYSHGLPILPPRQNPPTSFFDVVLQTQSCAVRLRFQKDNLYLNGYRPEDSDQWYEFNNDSDTHLIDGSTFLGYESSYIDLERVGSTRDSTDLGRKTLIETIKALAAPSQTSSADTASSLMVVIQMISEGIRYTGISEYLFTTYYRVQPPTGYIIALENGWAVLSEALLLSDQYPDGSFSRRLRQPNDMNISEADQAVDVIGILLQRTIPSNRLPRSISKVSASDPQGRISLEIFWVRINNISCEHPGGLYGNVNATDGLGTQSLYSRTSDNYESISPDGHILLTGPPRAVPASGDFTIDLDLWNYDSSSAENQVAHGRVKWNAFDFTNTYDNVRTQQIEGADGGASVNYVVLSNAAEALIEIILINGHEEDLAKIYGNLEASSVFGEVELYRKTKDDFEYVRQGSAITLLRKAVAIPIDSELVVKAELWDPDSISGSSEIANGSAIFSPEIDVSQAKKIDGKHGQVEVRVCWY